MLEVGQVLSGCQARLPEIRKVAYSGMLVFWNSFRLATSRLAAAKDRDALGCHLHTYQLSSRWLKLIISRMWRLTHRFELLYVKPAGQEVRHPLPRRPPWYVPKAEPSALNFLPPQRILNLRRMSMGHLATCPYIWRQSAVSSLSIVLACRDILASKSCIEHYPEPQMTHFTAPSVLNTYICMTIMYLTSKLTLHVLLK
jgi:hypothetical protein